jgi:dihydrodipicolinate synthase/N-acetylneuraminate lyase
VLPELTRALYDAVRAGDLPAANALQHRVTALFDPLLEGADFPEGVRVGVGLRGIRMGPSRQPATDGQLLDRERLAARLWDLLEANGVRRDDPAAAAEPGPAAARV